MLTFFVPYRTFMESCVEPAKSIPEIYLVFFGFINVRFGTVFTDPVTFCCNKYLLTFVKNLVFLLLNNLLSEFINDFLGKIMHKQNCLFMKNTMVQTLCPYTIVHIRKSPICNYTCITFIAIGMHTNVLAASPNIQLHIFEVTTHQELKLVLHTLNVTT